MFAKMITLPFEARDAARKLGFTQADFAPMPEWHEVVTGGPILTVGGSLRFPRIDAGWGYSEYDSDLVSTVKKSTKMALSIAYEALIKSNEAIIRAMRDQRYTETGRVDAVREIYRKQWIKNVTDFAYKYESFCQILNREANRLMLPEKLAANSNDAIIDSEYRSIVRGMEASKRFLSLRDMVTNDPRSPVVAAVLRADPVASEISLAQHQFIAATVSVHLNKEETKTVWGAAALLDSCRLFVEWATWLLAKPAALENSSEYKLFMYELTSTAGHGKLLSNIAAIVDVLERTEIIHDAQANAQAIEESAELLKIRDELDESYAKQKAVDQPVAQDV